MATRKSITTSHAAVACDVCGRTLLRGEHADAFIAGGSRRMVCELCVARAANEGWIREGADNTLVVRANGGRRAGRSLLDRLRSKREGAGAPELELPYSASRRTRVERIERARAAAPDAAEPASRHDPEHVAGEPPPQPEAEAVRHAREPEPVSRRDIPREPRHVHAIPTNADLKMERALDVFNASPHPRRVAGVSRSLGAPFASVMPSETEGSIVTIVVAWELCWYRYEVDLADEAAGVRVLAQGAELTELTAEEQQPNAAADERGLLVLAE
jgi:hypothetical protein